MGALQRLRFTVDARALGLAGRVERIAASLLRPDLHFLEPLFGLSTAFLCVSQHARGRSRTIGSNARRRDGFVPFGGGDERWVRERRVAGFISETVEDGFGGVELGAMPLLRRTPGETERKYDHQRGRPPSA